MKGRCFMKDMFLWSSSLWDNYESEEEARKNFGEIILENSTYESEEEITFNDIPCYAGELSNYMLFISDFWSDKNGNNYHFVISQNKLKLIIYISGAPYMNIDFIIYKCKEGLTKYTAPFPS